MTTTPVFYRNRAEHYRQLACLISDETAHQVLLTMAREFDDEDKRCGHPPEPLSPMPRTLS